MSDDSSDGFPSGVGAPARRALESAGYTKMSQLADVPKSELAKLHGIGPKALGILEKALQEQRKSLG